MTAQEFVYWLQGHLELTNVDTLDARQVQIIKDHISLVLHKVTPERKDADLYPPFGTILPTRPGTWINRPGLLCDAKDVQVTCCKNDKVVDALKAAEMSHSIAIGTNGGNWGEGSRRDLIAMFGDPPGSC